MNVPLQQRTCYQGLFSISCWLMQKEGKNTQRKGVCFYLCGILECSDESLSLTKLVLMANVRSVINTWQRDGLNVLMSFASVVSARESVHLDWSKEYIFCHIYKPACLKFYHKLDHLIFWLTISCPGSLLVSSSVPGSWGLQHVLGCRTVVSLGGCGSVCWTLVRKQSDDGDWAVLLADSWCGEG